MRAAAVLVLVLALPALAGCATPGVVAPPPDAGLPAAWLAHASAPTPRTEVTAAVVGDVAYAIGGFVEGSGPAAALVASGVVEAYDLREDRWSPGPDYPFPVHHTASAVVDGVLFVLGGFAGTFVPTALSFKLEGGRWTPIAPLPQPRGAHGAAVVDGKVYVVGGASPTPDRGLALTRAVHVYDPASDRWTSVADLPTPRDHLAVAAVAGKVYAAAGQELSHAASVDALEAFDPATGEWTSLPPVPVLRNSLAAAALDDRLLVVMGGQDDERTYADAEAFDPEAGTWTTLSPLATPRHGLGAVAWEGRVFAMLGGPEPGLSVTGAVESIGRA